MTLSNDKNGQIQPETGMFGVQCSIAYGAWRERRLSNYPIRWDESIVTLSNLANPSDTELLQIVNFCSKYNMAIYDSASNGQEPIPKTDMAAVLASFCARLGLITMEQHRSAQLGGIVSIEQNVGPTSSDRRGGYIPYTDKPLSWHTDGYYNAPVDRIRAMVLHCRQDALEGGVSELLDPEIVYIRMRDENIDYIKAFMHPQAMTIPENTDPRSPYRPDSVGPVFEVDKKTGALTMRYSARTRNIIWRDDPITLKARDFLTDLLKNEPLIVRHKLKSGQGVICNNVLHNRTGFIDASNADSTRLLYRIRYKERIKSEL